MSEKSVLNKLQLLATSIGNRLFRNSNGMGYTGDVRKLKSGDILIKNPRPIKYGLCVGSGDLIGWTQIKIEPHHVGRTFLVFTNYEVKTNNTKPSTEQQAFHDAIIKLGGISIIEKFATTDIKGNNYVESINKFSAISG
jgi:hypothetical protein